jgi:hypothetical protein
MLRVHWEFGETKNVNEVYAVLAVSRAQRPMKIQASTPLPARSRYQTKG